MPKSGRKFKIWLEINAFKTGFYPAKIFTIFDKQIFITLVYLNVYQKCPILSYPFPFLKPIQIEREVSTWCIIENLPMTYRCIMKGSLDYTFHYQDIDLLLHNVCLHPYRRCHRLACLNNPIPAAVTMHCLLAELHCCFACMLNVHEDSWGIS